MITSFADVFDDKLKRLKKMLKSEFEKDRSKRDKKLIKSVLHEAKDLRKTLKDMRLDMKEECECPKCGHKFFT